MNPIRSTGVQGLIVAVLIHVVGVGSLFVIDPPEQARAGYLPRVKVRVASRPEPPEPKAQQVKASPPEVEKPIVVEPKKPLERRVASVKKTKVPKTKPAAPAAPPAPVKSATPRKFTVAMEATIPGGGVAVPASTDKGWSFGAPDGDEKAEKVLAGPAPARVEENKTPAAVEAAGVTRLPRLKSQPELADMRAAYPEEARRKGEEANVYLKILVTAEGRVSRVRIIRSSGSGFDRAARELVQRFRFRPGEVDGRPVAVWIPWTYKFRLEG